MPTQLSRSRSRLNRKKVTSPFSRLPCIDIVVVKNYKVQIASGKIPRPELLQRSAQRVLCLTHEWLPFPWNVLSHLFSNYVGAADFSRSISSTVLISFQYSSSANLFKAARGFGAELVVVSSGRTPSGMYASSAVRAAKMPFDPSVHASR